MLVRGRSILCFRTRNVLLWKGKQPKKGSKSTRRRSCLFLSALCGLGGGCTKKSGDSKTEEPAAENARDTGMRRFPDDVGISRCRKRKRCADSIAIAIQWNRMAMNNGHVCLWAGYWWWDAHRVAVGKMCGVVLCWGNFGPAPDCRRRNGMLLGAVCACP